MLEDALGPTDGPLPWLWGAAARFAGEDAQALGRDAGVVARSLANAVDLFDLPAVCTSFDTVREAEALGCAVGDGSVAGFVDGPNAAFEVDVAAVVEGGRVPATLDATERLASSLDGGVLGGLTGPATLTGHLLEGAPADHDAETVEETLFTATDACVELVNAHLDRGADGVALLEPSGVGGVEGYADVASAIANVLDHYEVPGVVVTDRADLDTVAAVGELGLDAVTGGVEDPAVALETAAAAGVTLGVGIPPEPLLAGPDALDAFLDGLPDGCLVSTAWTVPDAVEPEPLHRLMGSL